MIHWGAFPSCYFVTNYNLLLNECNEVVALIFLPLKEKLHCPIFVTARGQRRLTLAKKNKVRLTAL